MCLSNQRQLLVGWTSYSTDYNGFPVGRAIDYYQKVRWGWGGVHWYGSGQVPFIGTDPQRPLNIAVAGDELLEQRIDVFRCPSDSGASYSNSGASPWAQAGAGNASGEGDRTTFGLAGTSYQANGWMYCQPGANTGWGAAAPGAMPPRYRDRLGPQNIPIAASRFIVLGDTGSMSAGAYTPTQRAQHNMFAGWWHGSEQAQMGFLDGSARRITVGAPVGRTYSYYADPTKHTVLSWRTPWAP